MTESEPAPTRRGLRATLLRWRAPLVLVPLLVAIAYSGTVGARMLWGEPTRAPEAAPVVTCWDGSEEVAADCTEPTGVAGLRWVFPSFKPGEQRCSKVEYENAASGPLEYACRKRVEGTTARISYSERATLEGGLTFFANRYDGVDPVPTAAGTRTIYRESEPRGDGRYDVTVAYVNHPYAVTVTAVNERLRDKVLSDAVTFRPERYLMVRPTPASEAEE
jgi:hypothetical protein